MAPLRIKKSATAALAKETTMAEEKVNGNHADDHVEKALTPPYPEDGIHAKRLFNPEGNDAIEVRRIIKGNPTNLFNLNDVKYQWANRSYRWMMSNFWIPEKVDLSMDVLDYNKISPSERRAYDGILSFLVFLDSIQTNNLPQISDYITAPEVGLVLAIQDYQEAIHSQAYAYVIETIVPKASRESIYEFWRQDKILFERIKYIADIYQSFIDHPNDHNFARVIVANYLLEGLYFYNGFMFFYTLASRSMMSGTAAMIKYINRDEYSHCKMFENIIKTVRDENPGMLPDELVYDMFRKAVDQEITWSKYIIGEDVVGITNSSIDKYTRWMANERLKDIGFAPLYEEYTENPYKHLDRIADVGGEGHVKGNFFEATVTSYNMSTAISGWDQF